MKLDLRRESDGRGAIRGTPWRARPLRLQVAGFRLRRLLAALVIGGAASVQAQGRSTTVTRDASGRTTGSMSIDASGRTVFRDASGRTTGSAVRRRP